MAEEKVRPTEEDVEELESNEIEVASETRTVTITAEVKVSLNTDIKELRRAVQEQLLELGAIDEVTEVEIDLEDELE